MKGVLKYSLALLLFKALMDTKLSFYVNTKKKIKKIKKTHSIRRVISL